MTTILPVTASGEPTFLALQSECLNYGFSSSAYRTRMATWLNEGYDVIQRRYGLAEQEQTLDVLTTRGTSVVSALYGEELDRLVSVVVLDTPTAPLEPVERAAFDGMDQTVTGRPGYYAMSTGTDDIGNGVGSFLLLVWPVPDAGYTIRTRFNRIYRMNVDTDVPDRIPPGRRWLLVHYAVAKAYLSEDDPEMARVHMDMFNREAAEVAISRKRPVRDGPTQVPGTWGG